MNILKTNEADEFVEERQLQLARQPRRTRVLAVKLGDDEAGGAGRAQQPPAAARLSRLVRLRARL